MNKKSDQVSAVSLDALQVRLDAILLLMLTSKFADEKGKIKISEVAPILHLAGYTPTEIVKFLGKKKAQDVAPYLYKKKTKGNRQ